MRIIQGILLVKAVTVAAIAIALPNSPIDSAHDITAIPTINSTLDGLDEKCDKLECDPKDDGVIRAASCSKVWGFFHESFTIWMPYDKCFGQGQAAPAEKLKKQINSAWCWVSQWRVDEVKPVYPYCGMVQVTFKVGKACHDFRVSRAIQRYTKTQIKLPCTDDMTGKPPKDPQNPPRIDAHGQQQSR